MWNGEMKMGNAKLLRLTVVSVKLNKYERVKYVWRSQARSSDHQYRVTARDGLLNLVFEKLIGFFFRFHKVSFFFAQYFGELH